MIVRFIRILVLIILFCPLDTTLLFATSSDTTDHSGSMATFLIDGCTFFHNAEYFNPYIDGYTLPGFWVTPKLKFLDKPNLSASTGILFHAYSGESKFNRVYPFLQATWQFIPDVYLRIGLIENNQFHWLDEFFYFRDHFLRKPYESGLQFEIKQARFTSDLWLDWENFIDFGDQEQEKIWFGYRAEFTPELHNHRVSFPVYLSAYHRGGQVNDSEQNVSTIYNGSAGIQISAAAAKMLTLEFTTAFYSDPTKDAGYFYTKGHAFFTALVYKKKHMKIKSGYWFARHFISPKGNPVFLSLSEKDPSLIRPDSRLIYVNLNYSRNINQGNTFSFFTSWYFDTQRLKIDYNMGIALTFNGRLYLN